MHYIISNVQIYFRSSFLKRLSDTSEIMKAQTHWLPHWKAANANATADAGPYIIPHCPEGTSAVVPFDRFSMLIISTE